MRCIYLVLFLSSTQLTFSGPLPLQPFPSETLVEDISTLLEKRSVPGKRKDTPFYHYVCKVTESIHGLELKQENDQIFCEYLAPDGTILLTGSFAPAFSEHQEIKEVADKFINTNRMPSRWIFESKGLCYLHEVVHSRSIA